MQAVIGTFPRPRQLALAGFSAGIETTRSTDDAVLRAAIGRLFEIPEFLELTRSTQEVLIALLARRDFRNPTEIHPSAWHQDFIAEAAGVSRSTVKRAYAVLEGLGWLVRGEQAYDARHKRFEGTPIAFDPAFADTLGLKRTFDAAAREIAPRAPKSTFSVSPVGQNEPLIKEDSLEQSSSKRQSAGSRQVENQKPVPSELFCLIQQGLSAWTVFWLMKLAGKANKRLSDIVDVKRDAILKRKGRLLVGFIKHLIGQDIDFAWQKRTLQAVAEEQATSRRAEDELEAFDGQTVCVDGAGRPIAIRRRDNGSYHGEVAGNGGSVPHSDLIKLVRAGRLQRWAGESNREEPTEKPDNAVSNRAAARNALSGIRQLVGIRA